MLLVNFSPVSQPEELESPKGLLERIVDHLTGTISIDMEQRQIAAVEAHLTEAFVYRDLTEKDSQVGMVQFADFRFKQTHAREKWRPTFARLIVKVWKPEGNIHYQYDFHFYCEVTTSQK